VGRRDPRIVTSGPHNRMMVKLVPTEVTRQYEESTNISTFKEVELVNCASNNYGGFSQLEFGAEKVIESALRKLPFAPAPAALEEKVRSKCAEYMGFEACVTAPSGFSTNVLAFATVAGVARSQGRKLIFLCDRDCHNSMLTGAYYNKEARVHKFDHNDLTDLDYKLRMCRKQDPSALICVAVEGIYRYVFRLRLRKNSTDSREEVWSLGHRLICICIITVWKDPFPPDRRCWLSKKYMDLHCWSTKRIHSWLWARQGVVRLITGKTQDMTAR